MTTLPFQGMTPTRVLWVSASAPAGGDGSAAHPFNLIQLAVNKSTPGTAIMVEAGTYHENVLITSDHSGTSTAPIWLVSANGPGAAIVEPKDQGMAAIGAGGVSNLVIEGFETIGGRNGIQISQDGLDWTKMVDNVVVEGNIIQGAKEDGIKADGGDAVYAVNNTISNGEGQQGIDYLGINNSVIANNTITGITGTCGIYVKGGCYNDTISGNYIANTVQADGIGVGWHTGDFGWRPGYSGYEASHITVTGNDVVNVGGRALTVHGGVDSTITGNYFSTNGQYYTIAINDEVLAKTTLYSANDNISNNTLATTNNLLNLTAGNSTGLVMQNNHVGAAVGGAVGAQAVSLLHVSTSIPSTTPGNTPSGSHGSVSIGSTGATPLSGSATDAHMALPTYSSSTSGYTPVTETSHTTTEYSSTTYAELLAQESHAATYAYAYEHLI